MVLCPPVGKYGAWPFFLFAARLVPVRRMRGFLVYLDRAKQSVTVGTLFVAFGASWTARRTDLVSLSAIAKGSAFPSGKRTLFSIIPLVRL